MTLAAMGAIPIFLRKSRLVDRDDGGTSDLLDLFFSSAVHQFDRPLVSVPLSRENDNESFSKSVLKRLIALFSPNKHVWRANSGLPDDEDAKK
jgi:hypothetical protein